MKALGISFGRKMRNSEVMVKQVLLQLRERGFDIDFIRALDLDIKPCTGCNACVSGLMAGKNGACSLKDDFHIIDEALMQADAVVVCAPVYCYSPSGLFKTVCDRLGPSHDVAFRRNALETGKKRGLPAGQLVDEIFFKPRALGLLSVGGAKTKNWTSLGLPMTYQFNSMGMNAVDAYGAYSALDYEHIVVNDSLMERMTAMGDHLADALTEPGGLERWYGDEPGVCPVCHNDLLTVLHDGGRVECPICGTEGELRMEDGELRFSFTPENIERSRQRYGGHDDHYREIRDNVRNRPHIDDLAGLLKKYEW